MEIGNHYDAAEAYLRLTKIDSKDKAAFKQLGYAYTYLNKFKEAIHAYEKAISIDSKYAEAYFKLGIA